ncbi:ABC transporter ATP-binding protein [Alicyclobacillus cycloheptanicus]|uniref:Heme ABC exporter ATP-binding subunit CcmA n=1 Tax=Alicyclobacillus cycloheptanicus TaxID=1457 RepID=A0ABT9XDM5_9BACL|nr:ABC transporter ATP-binding protein [Alicyclobacillus cycloheptanicus]MDQ0188396.1 heme ABC exporter ATP-binding subunit CcmA [Alicyclobacillus cycloheptanicus]WDM01102.1 ABC transporter ATP-binding protein [Alicyclobacillus cycloheptanicus]
MLALADVTKEYDFRPVLANVNLTLEPGKRYALTAPNGSGKTTLLHMMCGLSRPSRGAVTWQGKPLSARARRQMGVVLQQGFLYGDLTAVENLLFYARLYGLSGARKLAQDWVQRVGLNDAADLKVKEFSKGMKQRLSLARALLHEPALLLLDEPYDGLDRTSRQLFQDVLSDRVRSGATVFLVTHQEDEARFADTHLTLQYGRLVEVR